MSAQIQQNRANSVKGTASWIDRLKKAFCITKIKWTYHRASMTLSMITPLNFLPPPSREAFWRAWRASATIFKAHNICSKDFLAKLLHPPELGVPNLSRLVMDHLSDFQVLGHQGYSIDSQNGSAIRGFKVHTVWIWDPDIPPLNLPASTRKQGNYQACLAATTSPQHSVIY